MYARTAFAVFPPKNILTLGRRGKKKRSDCTCLRAKARAYLHVRETWQCLAQQQCKRVSVRGDECVFMWGVKRREC